MGYKYENRLDQANEDERWRNRPEWLRRAFSAAEAVFAGLIILLGATAMLAPVWQMVAEALR